MHGNSVHKSTSRLGTTRKFLDGIRPGPQPVHQRPLRRKTRPPQSRLSWSACVVWWCSGSRGAWSTREGISPTPPVRLTPGLSGKQLDLLKEAVPSLSRVGVVWDTILQTWRETGWRIVPMGLWKGNAHED